MRIAVVSLDHRELPDHDPGLRESLQRLSDQAEANRGQICP
jgi:hypothetical protein